MTLWDSFPAFGLRRPRRQNAPLDIKATSASGIIFHSKGEPRFSSMNDLVPNIRGPKLHPFSRNIQNLNFIRLLSSENIYSPSSVPHSRVFEVEIDAEQFALKVVSWHLRNY